MVSPTTVTTVKNFIKDEDDEECFEACIFNCTYAQDQLESEEKVYSWNKRQEQMEQQQRLQNKTENSSKSYLATVVSNVPSDESSFADDRSLLDDDSSSQNS